MISCVLAAAMMAGCGFLRAERAHTAAATTAATTAARGDKG